MVKLTVNLTFVHGQGLANLQERRDSIRNAIFSVKKVPRGRRRKGVTIWIHDRYRGEIRLVERDGVFRAEIRDQEQALASPRGVGGAGRPEGLGNLTVRRAA